VFGNAHGFLTLERRRMMTIRTGGRKPTVCRDQRTGRPHSPFRLDMPTTNERLSDPAKPISRRFFDLAPLRVKERATYER
jgi:hypothetical protein